MSRSFFSAIDNLSLQDIESEADLIPLLTTEDEEALENEALPKIVPILPLRNTVLFPGVVIPITAGRDKSIAGGTLHRQSKSRTNRNHIRL